MADARRVIAVLGDFGGMRDLEHRLVAVEPETLDRAMQRRGVVFEANVAAAGGEPRRVALPLASLDDLHPERLVARLPELAALLQARAAVPDAAALEALGVAAPPPAAPSAPAAGGSLLDRVLDAPGAPAPRPPLDPALERLVRAAAEPALARGDRATLAAWQEAVDARLGRELRAVLHHPRFRALEAAWRGLDRLVRDVAGEERVAIRVLDLPKAELARDLAGGDEPAVLRLLGEAGAAAIVADYAFGAHEVDLALLEVLAAVAAQLGAPLLAAAAPSLLGLEDFRDLGAGGRTGGRAPAAGWRQLRASEAGSSVALCLPRLLLRLPYGAASDPVAGFAFEEVASPGEHTAYLWGGAPLAVAAALATGEPLLRRRPLHVWREDGEARALPCAEVLMTQETVERVTEEGFVVLAPYRDRDEVRVCGLRTASGRPLGLSTRA
jgi:type VI secretion system protein ImpC